MPIGLKGREWSQERLWGYAHRLCLGGIPEEPTLTEWSPHTLCQGAEPKGICSLCHMANGFGAKPRKWVKGLVLVGCRGKAHALRSIILSMAKTLGKFSRPEPWGRNRTDTTMCPPPLQIAGKACNSMYLSHFHRLRQWIQKRVQIIKLSQKVNTKFQKSLKLRLLRCVQSPTLISCLRWSWHLPPLRKFIALRWFHKYAKAFYHSLAGPACRPMGSRCSWPALRAPLGIRGPTASSQGERGIAWAKCSQPL